MILEVGWRAEDFANAHRARRSLFGSGFPDLMARAVVALVLFVATVFFAMVIARLLGQQDLADPAFRRGLNAMLVSGLLVVLAISTGRWLVARRLAARERGSIFHAGPWRIAISAKGIDMAGPASHDHLDWTAVSSVRDMRGGLVIGLGPISFLPLPERGFPSGIDRSELRRRIALWRREGGFGC